MLPQNKFQDVIFTLFMAFVMVYAMICYNIALNVGGLQEPFGDEEPSIAVERQRLGL